MKRLISLIALLALALPLYARAQAPSTVSYQGVLTNNLGTLVPDGDYDLSFRIFTTALGPPPPAAVWSEAHLDVPVVNGGFSVILGSITPLTLAFDVPYWLSIQVGADPELSPRVELASSPYSLSLRIPFVGTAADVGPSLWIKNTGTGPAIKAESALGLGLLVEGNAHVNGLLTMAFAPATSNRAALTAYANIASDGTLNTGTPNVSSSWDALSSRYLIIIAGEAYNTTGFVATVTPQTAGVPRFATTTAASGQLAVKIWDVAGAAVQNSFHVVIYKP